MKKYLRMIALFLASSMLLGIILAGCSGGNKSKAGITETKIIKESNSSEKDANTITKTELKVGIVLSTTNKSFNDSAIEGLENAKKSLGITYKDIQPKEVADCENSLEFLANNGYNLIFAIGIIMQNPLVKVAPKYPKVKFAIIDVDYGNKALNNVLGLVFKDQQGSFLAGALAASISKSNVVGFVGGMEAPLIYRFEGGFTAGVRAINPDVKILSAYVGTDETAFNNPDKGKEIALDFISKNADVIFHAAGESGQGVFEACSVKGIKAIGCNSNQNWIKPGTIIASVLKRVDVAVGNTVKAVIDGTYQGGKTQAFGFAEDGVGLTDLINLAPEETTGLTISDQQKIKDMKSAIPQSVRDRIEDLKKKIISGDIKVPDWSADGKPTNQ